MYKAERKSTNPLKKVFQQKPLSTTKKIESTIMKLLPIEKMLNKTFKKLILNLQF